MTREEIDKYLVPAVHRWLRGHEGKNLSAREACQVAALIGIHSYVRTVESQFTDWDPAPAKELEVLSLIKDAPRQILIDYKDSPHLLTILKAWKARVSVSEQP